MCLSDLPRPIPDNTIRRPHQPARPAAGRAIVASDAPEHAIPALRCQRGSVKGPQCLPVRRTQTGRVGRHTGRVRPTELTGTCRRPLTHAGRVGRKRIRRNCSPAGCGSAQARAPCLPSAQAGRWARIFSTTSGHSMKAGGAYSTPSATSCIMMRTTAARLPPALTAHTQDLASPGRSGYPCSPPRSRRQPSPGAETS
jgi:hypothetical protein